MQYSTLKDTTEIEHLAEEWHQLLAETHCDRAFSSATWYLTSCRSDPPDALRVMTARRRGVLTGVLPMVVRGEQLTFNDNLANYQDLIAKKDDEETLAGLLDYAFRSLDERFSLKLEDIRSDANLIAALTLLFPDFGFDHLDSFRDCCHIRLEGDYEDYLATKSSNFRSHLRRAQRKATRDGIHMRELLPHHLEPASLPDKFLFFHMQRFGHKSCFTRPAEEAFAHQALPALFREGRLRVFGLFREDELQGIDLNMVGRRSLGSWNGGYLTEMQPWSPGKLMLINAIKTAVAEGLGEVDLLRGNQPWKLHWATGKHQLGYVSMSHRGALV